MAKGYFIINDSGKRFDVSKDWIKIVSMSFLVISVATMVTTVNREYFYDGSLDQDDLYIVKPVDRINNMQSAVFKMVEASTTHNKQCYHTDNNMVLATLHGQEAIKILEQLQEGNMIQFDVSYDDVGNPVIELVKDINIIDNIPDDKKRFTSVSTTT